MVLEEKTRTEDETEKGQAAGLTQEEEKQAPKLPQDLDDDKSSKYKGLRELLSRTDAYVRARAKKLTKTVGKTCHTERLTQLRRGELKNWGK